MVDRRSHREGGRAQVEAIAENIVALAEQAQAIGEIIAAVTDIADQTRPDQPARA